MESLVRDVAAEMSAGLDDAATAVADAIHAGCSGLQDDLYVETRQSTRANAGLITTMIREGADPTVFRAPEEALAYARSYARQGLDLRLLTRVYREAEHAYERLWRERFEARAVCLEELTEAMGYFSDWLFAYISAIDGPLGDAYAVERERRVRGGPAARAQEVRRILAGGPVDVTEAGRRLRYRLDARHVGFVIWTDGDDDAQDAREMYAPMGRFASEVVGTIGASGALSVPLGRCFAGWATVEEEIDVRGLRAPRGLHLSVGRAGSGVEGFRRSHQEALLARRVGSLAQRPPHAVAFDSIALDALLTHDLPEAQRFAREELGALLDDSDANRRLVATLETFLQEESSYVRTARRLGVHQNTVAYRVRRAEELLGHRAGERQLELRAALRLVHFVRAELGPASAG